VIRPRHLVRGGVADWSAMEHLLAHPEHGEHPSRAVEENLVDLAAQVAANHRGARLLEELARAAGAHTALLGQMEKLRNRAARHMRQVLAGLDDGVHAAEERLDDGTPLRVAIRVSGDRAEVDLTGSGRASREPERHRGHRASAVLYLLRCWPASPSPSTKASWRR
jgi:5-oxoprolinase (ATP-hydrolysing)